MAQKVKAWHKTIRVNKNMTIHYDFNPDRLNRNIENAQKALDIAVMTHMEPYMPKRTGTFINLTKQRSLSMIGTGKVCAAAPPMGRFLYEGKGMVGE